MMDRMSVCLCMCPMTGPTVADVISEAQEINAMH